MRLPERPRLPNIEKHRRENIRDSAVWPAFLAADKVTKQRHSTRGLVLGEEHIAAKAFWFVARGWAEREEPALDEAA